MGQPRGHTQDTPGEATTRDGRALCFTERGGPGPVTVVFGGGLGSVRAYWALVRRDVAGSPTTWSTASSALIRSRPRRGDPGGRRGPGVMRHVSSMCGSTAASRDARALTLTGIGTSMSAFR